MGELAVAVGLRVGEVSMIGGERPLVSLFQRSEGQATRLLKEYHEQFGLEASELRRRCTEQRPNPIRVAQGVARDAVDEAPIRRDALVENTSVAGLVRVMLESRLAEGPR